MRLRRLVALATLTLTTLLTAAPFARAAAAEPRVKLGNEVLAANGFRELAGKRVGLITNPSGVNSHLISTLDVLRAAPGVKLVALFGPEHGIYGDVPAGDKVESRTDTRTGLPVHSLYGATRKPTPKMLEGLDALVYDLQDTGSRSYTFISTMGLAMDACGEAGIEFIVLDRPNPLGGERIEGPLVEEKFRSFVSQWDLPYVYGLTCGEVARFLNAGSHLKHPCKLTVIPLEGWRRSMVWRDTGLPWVPASPHIPHGDSPLFQVATGVIGELSNVSVGVGYTLPFQVVGLPKLDPHAFAANLNARGLSGVVFRPLTYKPYYATAAGEILGGVQLHFTDPAHAPLTALNFHALDAIRAVTGRDVFAEAVKAGKKFELFDKVNGTDATRLALEAGKPAAEIVASWKSAEDKFRAERKPFLLYR